MAVNKERGVVRKAVKFYGNVTMIKYAEGVPGLRKVGRTQPVASALNRQVAVLML